MAEVLSQSEIDALLAAVSTGPEKVEPEVTQQIPKKKPVKTKEKSDWVAYDLTSHEKLVKGKLSAFQGINERFCRLFRSTLVSVLKSGVSVSHVNTDFIRFSEYLNTILLPTSVNIVSMKNLLGSMIFIVNSKLAYALVDAYYGGSERPYSKLRGEDEFTTIENSMIQKLISLAIQNMEEAWALNYPLKLEYIRTESNPYFIGSIHGTESVAVMTFDVQFESLSGPFVVIVPVRALEPIQRHLSINVINEVRSDDNIWRQHWLTEILALDLELRVELGGVEKRLHELNRIKQKDLIQLEKDAAEPLILSVEGIPKFKGTIGSFRGNNAIQILELIGKKE